MSTYQQLERIANENGGGLSVSVTGRYTSVRHEKARLNADKMTAGEAAKALRKRGVKATGKQLVALYRLLHHGRDPEWHHAGFIPGDKGGGMGRTYFFRTADLDKLAENAERLPALVEARQKAKDAAAAEKAARDAQAVTGIGWRWVEGRGAYGRKIWTKALVVYQGPEGGKPAKGWIPCDQDTYDRAKPHEGRIYTGRDEPILSEF